MKPPRLHTRSKCMTALHAFYRLGSAAMLSAPFLLQTIAPASAQTAVPVGSGSYASSTPASEEESDSYYALPQNQVAELFGMLHLDPSQAGKPIPTNKWWTDLLVASRSTPPAGASTQWGLHQDKYGGNMWFIPGMIRPQSYGIDIYTPNSWLAGTLATIDKGTGISLRGDIPYGLPSGDVIIADFESGYPSGTTSSGDAFASTPSAGSGIDNMISGHLANTRDGGDGVTGTLTLPEFTVSKHYLHFQMCGGNTTANQVRLVIGGTVVEAQSGTNSTALQWYTWDVSSYAGQTAHVEVVDDSTGAWGITCADQIFLSDAESPLGRFGGDMSATETLVTNWGDWNVDFSLADASSRKVDVTMARGIPFTWTRWTGDLKPKIVLGANTTFYDASGAAITVTGGQFTATAFAMKVGGKNYGVYLPDNTVCTVGGSGYSAYVEPQISTAGASNYVVIGYLPETDITTELGGYLSAFQDYAYARPTNTQISWAYQPDHNRVRTTWTVTATAMKGTNTATIQGFIPHHWRTTTPDFSYQSYTYHTQRGLMKVGIGSAFQLDFPFAGIVPSLPAPQALGLAHDFSSSRMSSYLTAFNPGTMLGETYGCGKALNLCGQMMGMAYEMGDTTNYNRLKTALADSLENWLTYTPGEANGFFSEYSDWKALIGWDASYGSQAFNDLHFHYGYYASAAAQLGRFDKTFLTSYGPMITKVVKSFANYDRADTTSPFLRTFDVWEGHSNAGGLSGENGENQESSSEAMNSWVGIYLLGAVMNDADMTAAGAMGYAMESRATNEYWQDLSEDVHPESFTKAGAGMVWGDNFTYATYFDDDPAWVYAIQYVPAIHWLNYLVPAGKESVVAAKWEQMWQERTDFYSAYSPWSSTATYAAQARVTYNQSLYYAAVPIAAGQAAPGTNPDWVRWSTFSSEDPGGAGGYIGNYLLGFQALWDANNAAALFDTYVGNNMAIADVNNSLAGTNYYTIHATRQLGMQDFTYAASVPTAAVYYNPTTNTRTAVIYNPHATATDVVLYKDGAAVQTVSVPADTSVTAFVGSMPSITSNWKADGMLSAEFEYQIAATNTPTSYGVTGTLPAGLSLNTSTGAITGTPTATGTSTVTIAATNASGTGSKQLTIEIHPFTAAPSITSATGVHAEIGEAFSYTITATNSPASYGVTGTLPAGLSLNTATGVISGTTTATAGSYVVTIGATGVGGTGTASLVISVGNDTLLSLNKTTDSLSHLGGNTSAMAVDSDADNTRWESEQNVDPQWMWVDLGAVKAVHKVVLKWEGAYGKDYKIQIADSASGPWTDMVTVEDNNSAGVKPYGGMNYTGRYVRVHGTERGTPWGYSLWDFQVWGGDVSGPVITSSLTAAGAVDSAFSYTITATNSPESFNATGLPDGLSIDTGTGVISGTPTETGVSNVTISATSASGTDTKTLVLTVNSPVPVITSALTAAGDTGTAFSYTITASHDPTSYSATGLPPGLSLNTSTGVISGSPALAGTHNVTIRAINGSGPGIATLVLTVNAPNIAAGITAGDVSSTEYGQLSYVTDGVPDGASRWGSQFNDDEWIYIDLGSEQLFDKVVLVWETAYGKDYKIQVSNNATDWTDIAEKHDQDGGTDEITFAAVTARYVKMQGIERGTIWGYSLFEFRVYNTGFGSINPPVISSSLTAGGTYATAFSYTITASNAPTSYGATGLPSGLGIDTETGVISGTPTAIGTSNVTITATNFAGTDTKTLVLTIAAGGSANLALGRPAEASTTEFGEPERVTDGVTDGDSRWASVYIDPTVGTPDTQWIYVDLGTPTTFDKVKLRWEAAYGKKYTIQASNDAEDWTDVATMDDQNGATDDVPFSPVTARYVRMLGVERGSGYGYSLYEFEVYNTGLGGEPPEITSELTAGAVVGQAFSYTITAANGPTSFSAADLPSWLTRSGATLSGTPEDEEGSPFTIPITATNGAGSDTKNLVLTVSTTPPTNNLAIGKTATASSPETGAVASKAIDGVLINDSRWQASVETEGTNADAAWIQVNLGQAYTISKVILRWETAYGKKYKIQTSLDGTNWTDQVTVNNGSGTVTEGTPNTIVHTINLPGSSGVEAQYVRMQGIERATGYGYSLYEFEIYEFIPPPTQTENQTIKVHFPVQNFSYGKVTVSPTPLSITPEPDLANGSNANGSVIVVQNPTEEKVYELTFPPNTDVTLTRANASLPIPGSVATMQTVDYKGDTITADSITTRAFDDAMWDFLVVLPTANPDDPPDNWITDPYLAAAPTPVPAEGEFGVSGPANNAMITDTRKPTFTWTAEDGASSYDLYVNISRTDYDWNAKGNLLDRFTKMNAAPITGTSYTLTTDLDDRWTYRWYVVANTGARSDMRTFSLYKPTLEQIDDGVSLIAADGLQFRDMNKNGTLEPYEDWRNTPAVRTADLLGRMTATQKAYQLFFNCQVYPLAGFGFGPFDPAYALDKQKAAAATPLGIPHIVLGDNIHGYKTSHPIQPGLAATRDNQIAWECADMQRREEVAVGYRGTLSPLSEVGTKVLHPRIQEGCGEDADFAAAQLRAMVCGLQGGPELNPKSLLITVKHWPSQGSGEDAVVFDGTTIWYHMRPWHGAFEANAACVMPGYSGSWLLNSQQHGAGDDAGILEFLRNTSNGMGYQNAIMTDWLPSGAWVRAAIAGSDIMGGADPSATVTIEGEGTFNALDYFVANVPIERINDACSRVLDLKFRMGVFEDPYGRNVAGVSEWQTPENVEIAYKAAAESLTLLKNDGAMPIRLPSGANIVVDGPRADDGGCMVTWRSDFHEDQFGCKTIYRAIKDRAEADGINVYSPSADTPVPVPSGTNIDLAIVVVGEAYYTHGTFWTQKMPWLPDDTSNGQEAHNAADAPQFSRIQAYRSQNIPTIVVCMLPRPYVLTAVDDLADSLMVVYRPGDYGGVAVANMLFGDFEPMGKLPWQLPRSSAQIGDAILANWQLQPDRWDLPFDMGVTTGEADAIKAVIAAGGSFPDLTTTGNPLFQHGFGIQGFGLTDSTPPAAFDTVTPANNAAITGDMPDLEWEASSDAQTGIRKYEVYIDGTMVYDTKSSAITSVRLSDLPVTLVAGSHSWYVKALNWAGNPIDEENLPGATVTPTATFSISDTTAPAAFAAVSPEASGTAPAGSTATFYWEQSSDAGTGIASYVMKLDGVDQTPVELTSASVSPTANIALGKAATASSSGLGTPGLSTDGSTSTRWQAIPAEPTTGPAPDAAWWQVDLGRIYSISEIDIEWESSYARDYDLQVSLDGVNWTTIKEARNMTGGNHVHHPHTGLSGLGRYVRFQGIYRGTQYGYSFYEFTIHGAGTESLTIPVSAGSHTWAVRAIDGAGNSTNNSNGTITFTKE